MSDVAAIVKGKFSLSLKHVKSVLDRAVYLINSSFKGLVDAFAERGKPVVQGHTFDVIATESNMGKMFPTFKIIITKRTIAENSHTFDFSTSQLHNNNKNITDVMTVLNDIINKFKVASTGKQEAFQGSVYFFELTSKDVKEPEPRSIPYLECQSYLSAEDINVFFDDKFAQWKRDEQLLTYLRELRWYILSEYNKICFRVELFKQICLKLTTKSDQIFLESTIIVELFYSLLEDCLNLLEENDDMNYPVVAIIKGGSFHYCNSVKCFQSLLNIIIAEEVV
jgi:hypothetical protein